MSNRNLPHDATPVSPIDYLHWGKPSLNSHDSSPIAIYPSLSLLRLFHLVSPALPIGAYHFSQGLEYAVHIGWVQDEASAFDWISGVAQYAVSTLDIPILLRIYDAFLKSDQALAVNWSRHLIAARETAELRAEERHLGKALAKVLAELGVDDANEWKSSDNACYAALFALAARAWSIDRMMAADAYIWAWAENQTLAALKLLPIGQTAGQRILNRLLQMIPEFVARSLKIADDEIGIATPRHGMASSWHETQYSRLFRS